MSNEADFTQHSKESTEALARVFFLCSDLAPCRKHDCKKCKAREAAWQRSMEISDMEWENAIWGETP